MASDQSVYFGTNNLSATANDDTQIIPFYAHPHVHTVIKDHTWYEETVAPHPDPDDLPYATAIVTGAEKGIDNTFIRINRKDVKDQIFGKSNFEKYGQASIQADVLFNGNTNVWFCRVLPDDATYSNVIVYMHYRKGKILDEFNNETGKVRLEVKFSVANGMKPTLKEGALTDDDIELFAQTYYDGKPDPQTGYITVPLCYIRSTGRGQYGNAYSVSISRDSYAEKEYDMKMYKFSLIDNTNISRVINTFAGSFWQTARYQFSTLIDDVLDQFKTGMCPVKIKAFESSFKQVYDFYREQIVVPNAKYIQSIGFSEKDLAELKVAASLTEETFDPLFGLKMNTRLDEEIPYYRNYTQKSIEVYEDPDLTIPDTKGASRPLNISDWTAAKIGSTVLVIADPLNGGLRWLYTISDIDDDSGNITYDEGRYCDIDEDQYDGLNISSNVGFTLQGGHDGEFQEITIDGETREPTNAEMKLLLSKEYVKAWRGEKDRKILSPARINIDFLFDANYNMTNDESINIETDLYKLFDSSTVLTDSEGYWLTTIGSSNALLQFSDINVKQAMYDLNEFRNRNGMTVDTAQGAGQSLYLDCGILGLKRLAINYELIDIINMVENFTGRACSIDLGYYDIFDPNTNKRITVTTSYYLAKNLVPHLIREGLNKPFVNKYATLRSIQRDSSLMVSGSMIRDSFRPDIDLIDWDVKERLYLSRINYWLTTDEGRIVQRAVQNTRQLQASCLLEENNVRVLNTLKKNLEAACTQYHYEWNDPTVRKSYTDAQMSIYKSWIGTVVEDIDIYFDANEFEQERMMMHCYCTVKFRDIVKRIILEINIERPDYASAGGE